MPIVNIPANELLEESNPKINANFLELDTRTGAVEGRFDGSGVLLPANLPSLARITPSVVASEAAMLALDAQAGDVAVRTDLDPDRSFMLGGDGNPATLANWIPISFAVSGAGTGHTIADEGTSLPARSKINFIGAGVTARDDSANDETEVEVPGVSGTSGPAWATQSGAGALFGSVGDANPITLAAAMNGASNVALTPSTIGTSNARCVLFRLPKTLAVSAIHLLGANSTTNLLRFAIYPEAAGSAKVWDSGALSSVAGTWSAISAGTPFTLNANTNYWFCVAATATGSTTPFYAPINPLSPAIYGANGAPLGGKQIGMGVYAQFACSAGAYPATLPTIAAGSYLTGSGGSIPFAFLEGSAS